MTTPKSIHPTPTPSNPNPTPSSRATARPAAAEMLDKLDQPLIEPVESHDEEHVGFATAVGGITNSLWAGA